MGTRSIIYFRDRHGNNYAIIYQQYDGYLVGVGKELAEFLLNIVVVNGISKLSAPKIAGNGAGCIAAQYVSLKKNRPGGLYLCSFNDKDLCEEYTYIVEIDDDKDMTIKIRLDTRFLKLKTDFMSPAEFLTWIDDVVIS